MGSRTVPERLRAAGARVEIHDDHFPQDAPDEAWIPSVGHRGWVILTKDKHIRHRTMELEAVRRAKARLFAVTSTNLTGPECGELLCRHLDRISRLARSTPGPFYARITLSRVVIESLRR